MLAKFAALTCLALSPLVLFSCAKDSKKQNQEPIHDGGEDECDDPLFGSLDQCVQGEDQCPCDYECSADVMNEIYGNEGMGGRCYLPCETDSDCPESIQSCLDLQALGLYVQSTEQLHQYCVEQSNVESTAIDIPFVSDDATSQLWTQDPNSSITVEVNGNPFTLTKGIVTSMTEESCPYSENCFMLSFVHMPIGDIHHIMAIYIKAGSFQPGTISAGTIVDDQGVATEDFVGEIGRVDNDGPSPSYEHIGQIIEGSMEIVQVPNPDDCTNDPPTADAGPDGGSFACDNFVVSSLNLSSGEFSWIFFAQ